MLEILLCSLLTIVPDYLFRRYAQGNDRASTCASKPWTIVPMVVPDVQEYIAAGNTGRFSQISNLSTEVGSKA